MRIAILTIASIGQEGDIETAMKKIFYEEVILSFGGSSSYNKILGTLSTGGN